MRRRTLLTHLAAAPWAASWLAGCGAGSGASTSGRRTYAYVASVGSNDIACFEVVDASAGTLAPVPGGRVSAQGGDPREIVSDRAGRFLYVADRNAGALAVFVIDPASGALSPIAGSPFGLVDTPFGLAMHPDGRSAVVSSVAGNAVFLLRLDPTTGVPRVAAGPFAAGPSGSAPGKVLLNAAGSLAFVANQFSRSVAVYAVDVANTRLTPIAGSPFDTAGDWVYQLALHPDESMLFATNYDSGTVTAFAVGAGGALTRVGTPMAAGIQPYGLFADAAGTHLYVASGGSAQIYGYDIDKASRRIAPMSSGPFDSGGTHGLALDPSGRMAIVAHFGEDTITTLTADATGRLVQRQHGPTGAQPLTIGFAQVG